MRTHSKYGGEKLRRGPLPVSCMRVGGLRKNPKSSFLDRRFQAWNALGGTPTQMCKEGMPGTGISRCEKSGVSCLSRPAGIEQRNFAPNAKNLHGVPLSYKVRPNPPLCLCYRASALGGVRPGSPWLLG